MKEYTIIGVFDDTGEVANYVCAAKDPYHAMQRFAEFHEGNPNLQVIGTIEGYHTLTPPGCDNIRAAYASDLVESEVA